MSRHAEQDAIDSKEFKKLFENTNDLEFPYDIECKFILITAGRLGLRAGEISHIHDDWIDWDRKRINIPKYHNCTRGIDGGTCGYCKKRARSKAKHNKDITLQDALSNRWNPKTETSARAVPFGFDDKIEEVIWDFFDEFEKYEHSRQSINRRVNKISQTIEIDQYKLYPHCLRATAATYHAYNGLSTAALQSLFGWKKMDVAEKYIRLTGEATARALEDTYS